MKTYCVDIDNTLFLTFDSDYRGSTPIANRVKYLNHLYDNGNTIKLFTARGSTTGIDWRSVTEQQLEAAGIKYHELIMGKPEADLFIDDKAGNEYLLDFSLDNVGLCTNILEHIEISKLLLTTPVQDSYSLLFSDCQKSLAGGGKIFFGGNGGSHADAQHLSAELVCRLRLNRRALPSVALGSNTAAVTAWSNDMDYESFLAREVTALATNRDTLVLLSTSGQSKNIHQAATAGIAAGSKVHIVCGDAKVALESVNIMRIPSNVTERVQECSMLILHSLCQQLEEVMT